MTAPAELPELIVEREPGVCTLSLNRPARRNALSPSLLWDIVDTLAMLERENEVRAVVIRGYGEDAFSAGFDLNAPRPQMAAGAGTTAKAAADVDRAGLNPLEAATNAIAEFPYPVIAMIYGYCIGAACELAATCDLRYAAANARLGMPPAKIGTIYRPSGMLKFLNLVGVAHTNELFFVGRQISAARAREIGLVNEALPRAELADHVMGVAREIAANAPLSVSGAKTIVRTLLTYQRLGAENEQKLQALLDRIGTSEDLKEGRLAFKEKRAPIWRGR
ncbi:MAG: enoyl-CoA hydratase/isomerase family protein [Chloroflexi bacterium]|nr:enoyl-CoA hydratase/isomerase family protein [Chloroflexota bacterium]